MEKNLNSLKGGGKITAAQYLTELLCINIATEEKKDLPEKFWQVAEWARKFRDQIQAVNGLLQVYDYRVIASALKDRKSRKIHSFRAPWLVPILDRYKESFAKLDANLENAPVMEKLDTTDSQPRKPQKNSQSLANKLRDL